MSPTKKNQGPRFPSTSRKRIFGKNRGPKKKSKILEPATQFQSQEHCHHIQFQDPPNLGHYYDEALKGMDWESSEEDSQGICIFLKFNYKS